MQQSSLRLEHYSLISLVLEPNESAEPLSLGSYADFGDASFGSEIALERIALPSGESRHSVRLSLEAEPLEGKPFPYKLKITMMGVFDGERFSEEKRDALVAANGASMLYGAARDIVLGLTQRNAMGPVMLPTVSFASLGEQIMAERKGSPGVT